MMKNKGIAFKLSILILTSSALIFMVIFWHNYRFSRQVIIKNIEENARNLAQRTVNRIEMVLLPVEKVPKNLADFIENSAYTGGDIIDSLRSVIENNSEIYGGAIAFEPYAYDRNSLFFAPYYYKSEGEIKFTYLGGESYRYFYMDWYQIPKELDHAVWSEPFYDEGGGGIIMATYSVPFYKKVLEKRDLTGVVTADISLSWLQEIVASIKIAETGYSFLISRNGVFVTHPDEHLIMNETIFTVAEARGDARLREIGRKMIKGKSGFVPFNSIVTGKKCWMVYAPLSSSGWSLAVLFPQDELMADITRLNHTVLSFAIAGFLLLLAVIVLIARSITRPLRALAGASEEIAGGNLDIELPLIKSRDEVGKLSESFAYMKASLKEYIKELTETTAAKERIESELKIAHDIQMGMLPKVFPPFPDRTEFDIYATLEPAKEVGGDLYDFFFMDDNHLCFTVGDVSGKGVPASLFMAVTQTLIKAKATKGLTTYNVLSRANEDLSLDNPSLMFVTLFLGILDIRTGEIEYCNGGHNPPYIIRNNGHIEPLETTKGMALGVMEDFSYKSKKFVLQKGETIFLYTDGVTEAMNDKEELFSDERTIEEIATLKDMPVHEIIDSMMEKVRAFSEGVPQTDDITMMTIRFYGR